MLVVSSVIGVYCYIISSFMLLIIMCFYVLLKYATLTSSQGRWQQAKTQQSTGVVSPVISRIDTQPPWLVWINTCTVLWLMLSSGHWERGTLPSAASTCGGSWDAAADGEHSSSRCSRQCHSTSERRTRHDPEHFRHALLRNLCSRKFQNFGDPTWG